jgi:hypothetical protein
VNYRLGRAEVTLSSPTPRLVALAAALTLTLLTSSAVRADKRGVLRVGVTPLQLTPAADTPFLGAHVDDAVEAYNAAADAYNQAHGYMVGSAQATAPIDRTALGVRSTLLTVAPALEAGNRYVYVRLEALLGFGETHRAYGVGFYPFNVAGSLRRSTIVPYLSAGGSASWLDDRAVDGELGALFTARVAAGVRFSRRMTIEVGYGVAALGGVVERGRLDTMTSYDPRGAAPPPHPTEALSGGEQQGMIDVWFGLAL